MINSDKINGAVTASGDITGTVNSTSYIIGSVAVGGEPVEDMIATVKDQLADKLSVSPQTLTPEQQAQARANIGITGTYYLTESDKAEIISAVIEALTSESIET